MPAPASPAWLTPRRSFAAALAVIALGVGWVLVALLGNMVAGERTGFQGFPLDDPWIHLQFARNLRDYGAFSYYRGEMITAGSTSPLYTFLLAAAFFVTRDELFMSWALGIGSFAAAALFFFLLLRRLVPGRPLLPLLGLALFVLEPRMLWAALSGMETPLYLAVVLASFWLFLERRLRTLAIVLGVCLWIRPEAVILTGILGALGLFDAFREARSAQPPASPAGAMLRRYGVPLAILAAFAVGYAAFNLHLAGSLLPNTYAAKARYYAQGDGSAFLGQVLRFCAGGHYLPIALLGAAGTVVAARRAARGGRSDALCLALWPLLVVAAYQIKLPFLYQQGRYLMPVLPAILALAIVGLDALLELAGNRRAIAAGATAAVMLAAFASSSLAMVRTYRQECRYISDRQVAAAWWMRDHLPPDAVVATHDVGAIAYYSERRVVDLVGLVTPDLIATIGDPPALTAALARKRATHLAVLRNWFGVENAAPLFGTDPRRPEVLEVFRFEPGRTRLTEPREP